MSIKIVQSGTEFEKVADLLLQLRNHLDKETLMNKVAEQQKYGYEVAFDEVDGRVRCAAGFIIATKLAWGKHMYIDDLVTDASLRGTGVGTSMLKWLKQHAALVGCAQIHLDSGVQRFAAHSFYLRNGFQIRSHHFCIPEL